MEDPFKDITYLEIVHARKFLERYIVALDNHLKTVEGQEEKLIGEVGSAFIQSLHKLLGESIEKTNTAYEFEVMMRKAFKDEDRRPEG